MGQPMLAAAAHAQSAPEPLKVLVHGLVKLWPLLILVLLAGIGKEAVSAWTPRRRRRPTSRPIRRSRIESPRDVRASLPSNRSSGLSAIDSMTGTQFERRLEILFRDLGYAVRHTGRLGDFGADLVIEKG